MIIKNAALGLICCLVLSCREEVKVPEKVVPVGLRDSGFKVDTQDASPVRVNWHHVLLDYSGLKDAGVENITSIVTFRGQHSKWVCSFEYNEWNCEEGAH